MNARTMRRLRQLHHYVGLFLAPAILLFSLSGALQTFRLQEEKGYGGPPPGWIVWMASVHKDQSLPRPKPEKASHAPDGKAQAPMTGAPKPAGPKKGWMLPLKIFVALLAIGLMISTLLGMAIALVNRTTRRTSVILLVAGTIVPLSLLLL
ncbi:hypothetical protein [Sphingobium nicotianae]|uniref:PepSY domain-containing protein n=1 Tax=Sphingobium nicotianae TaxID=2782607 RepID=A0A9X1IR16_9SPHN|nr:hypothetical protein [Sphingobium nicotianae]MBT2187004.1 hypothetical protein [Sphingobium nicotianae]